MKKKYFAFSVGLLLLSGNEVLAQSLKQKTPEPTPVELSNVPIDQSQSLLFRTRNYVAQIIWRRGIPYMTVSNNGWRVLSDVRAEVSPQRGTADSWTTYTAVSGDYMAFVRVSPMGEAAIEVTMGGRRVTEEYATSSFPPLKKSSPQPKSTQHTATAQRPSTVLAFDTPEYAVHVFQQQGNLFMNLYNRKTEKTDLKQASVSRVNTSEGIIYRHDGKSTVQAREDLQGRRILLIIRDNAIQYRGESF